MSRATPKLQELAERLIAHETKGNTPGIKTAGAFLVCEKLRPQLSTLMGNAGFRAVLSRALALATGEVPSLSTVHVREDGALERVDESAMQVESAEIAKGSVVLVSHLLGLLIAFIGEKLTVRIVSEAWPKVPLNNLEL